MKSILKIGVFDSGIGGLTVLHDCIRRLPQAQFYYLGDNGNAPYGSRPPEDVTALVRSALRSFNAINADAAVLACNTATAACADTMRREFSFPIIGMEPAVRPAALHCKNVLVICTPNTAASIRLSALIARFPQCRFTVFPAPELAAAIERAVTKGEKLSLSDHLPPQPDGSTTGDPAYDGVVLGCTHYLFFRAQIAAFYRVPIYDGNLGTAKRLAFLLGQERGAFKNCNTLGTDDHLNPTFFDSNQPHLSPIFLGKWANINEKAYKTNICFQNIL